MAKIELGVAMTKEKRTDLPRDKSMVTRHSLEVRYEPSGSFLDVRGYVADYIRNHGFFPHWQIESNTVQFRDMPDRIKLDGAFAGYKSAGYIVVNPATRNYFYDSAIAFWKLLVKNEHYKIPKVTRFGCRTLAFVPTKLSFEELNALLFKTFFTDKFREYMGGKQTDMQFVINLNEGEFEGRISGGPMHTKEAIVNMGFQCDEFEKCGLFLDIDYFKTKSVDDSLIAKLLQEAVQLSWSKMDGVANSLGL